MPNLFAAVAPDVLQLLLVALFVSLGVSTLILIVFLALVLAELTPGCLFSVFAATPPHLTAPFTLMSAAGPVVVLFLKVFFAALLTDLLVVLNAEAPIL